MQVMGVLNVTDDSFSDGGCYLDLDDAVKHGLAMAAAGAGIVDVGGESSRPGATRVDPAVETSRVIPVVKELAAQGITVSIDTMRADVARAALQNGAQMVNDDATTPRPSTPGVAAANLSTSRRETDICHRVRQKQQLSHWFQWSRMHHTGRTHACGHTDTGAVSGRPPLPATTTTV